MSRPEKPIDWNLVDNLLIAGCFGTEIAAHFDLHHETFYNRVQDKYGMGFTAYRAEKLYKGDSILRAKQFEKASKGDNMMLIWLGKNRLKQKDHDISNENPPNDTKVDKENENMELKAQIANLTQLLEKNGIDVCNKPKTGSELPRSDTPL